MLKISNNTLEKGKPKLYNLFPEIPRIKDFMDSQQTDGLVVTYSLPQRTYLDSKNFCINTHIVIGAHEGGVNRSMLDNPYLSARKGTVCFECTISRLASGLGYIVRLCGTMALRSNSNGKYLYNACKTLKVPSCQFELSKRSYQYYRFRATGDSGQQFTEIPDSEKDDDEGKATSNMDSQAADSDSDDTFRDMLITPDKRESAESLALRVKAEVTAKQIQDHLAKRVHKYSSGVKTYQWINGEAHRVRAKAVNPGEIVDPDLREDSGAERDIEKAKLLAARKLFTQAVPSQPTPGPIARLCLVSTFMLISFVAVTVVMYVYSENSIYKLRDSTSVTWHRSEIFYYMCDITYLSTSLALLREGTITNYENATNASTYETMLRVQMVGELDAMLDETKTDLKLAQLFAAVSDEFLTKKDIGVVFFSTPTTTTVKNYTFIDTLYMVSSAAITLSKTKLSDLSLTNLDLLFVRYNMLNAISVKVSDSVTLFIASIVDFVNQRKQLFEIIMYVVICFYLVAAGILYPFLLRAEQAQEDVLSLFLRMPKGAVSKLHDQCERYCAHSRSNASFALDQDREAEENETLIEKEAGSDSDLTAMQKRKFLKRVSNWWTTLGKVLAPMLLMDLYYVFDSSFFQYTAEVFNKHVAIIAITSLMNGFSMFTFLSLREAVMNTQMPILGYSNKWDVSSSMLMSFRSYVEGTVNVTPS